MEEPGTRPKRHWWQSEPAVAWVLLLFFPLGLWMMRRYTDWRPAWIGMLVPLGGILTASFIGFQVFVRTSVFSDVFQVKTVTYVNQTGTKISLYHDATTKRSFLTLDARTAKKVSEVRFAWNDQVVARDASGTILFNRRITWDDLKANGWQVVITRGSGGG